MALDKFYATESNRDAQLSACKTMKDVDKWEAMVKVAKRPVREAFYEATKDRNSRDNVMHYCEVHDIARMTKYSIPKLLDF